MLYLLRDTNNCMYYKIRHVIINNNYFNKRYYNSIFSILNYNIKIVICLTIRCFFNK